MRIPRENPDTDAIWRKWQEKTRCKHPSSTPRKKTASNGVIRVFEQCDQCGDQLKNIPKKSLSESQIAAIPDWTDEIARKFYARREELRQAEMDAARAKAAEEWQRRYQEYLQTPEWQEKRRLVLLRAQGICEGCRKAPATAVHHLHYRDAGDEFLWQLVAICDPCHERYHVDTDEPE